MFLLSLRRTQAFTLAALLSCAAPPLFGQVELTLPPMAAHLHVASADTATAPLIVSLASPTFFGAEPTDIAEDFRISGTEQDEVLINVPVGANYLFVSMNDRLVPRQLRPERR
ncbi:MAG: hypothetical protein ACI9EF_000354 [Pseudohongiellaceae bacterium]|jgi:hypothetical protein